MKTCAVCHAGGFLGEHLVTSLLAKGYTVRAGVNKQQDADSMAYFKELDAQFQSKLKIYECADHLKPGSFDELFDKADFVFLSSFPLEHQTKSDQLLADVKRGFEYTFASINKAKSSNQLKRVIFTSTAATIASSKLFNLPAQIKQMKNEADFNKESDPNSDDYIRVAAEEEALKWAKQFQLDMVIINAAFFVGPFLSKKSHGASVRMLRSILEGKQLEAAFPLVDVRDVAAAEVAAIEKSNAKGRYIVSEANVSFPNEMAKLLHKEFPDMKIDTNQKLSAPEGGRVDLFDTSKATSELGISIRHTAESIVAMAKSLERFDVVNLHPA